MSEGEREENEGGRERVRREGGGMEGGRRDVWRILFC